MTNDVAPGITRTRTYLTTPEMRARQLEAAVFSTPAMIGLMERTCVELTEPYLDANEQTVGIHVDVRHMAPTKIGQRVTVKVELSRLRIINSAIPCRRPTTRVQRSAKDCIGAR